VSSDVGGFARMSKLDDELAKNESLLGSGVPLNNAAPAEGRSAPALILVGRRMRRFLSPLRGSCRPCILNPRLKPWAIVGRP
jgi:hypothetical protein